MQLDSVGTPADLLALLKDTISVVQRESKTHSIQFERLPNTPMRIEVFTVPQLIHTALYEVLRNATAYSAEGSTVLVQLGIEDKTVVIVVQDEGRGIPQENLDTIWDVMIQAERQKYEQQGVGMGLPIVKQITRLHSGTVLLESEVNKGTRVTLRLPLYVES
jgi:signal transduction histidine kinase